MTPTHEPTSANATAVTAAPEEAKPVDHLSVKTQRCFFGTHIEGLAAYFGIQPVDLSISIAGVLANIAGPYAGLIDPLGERVPAHLNILNVSASMPRARALEAQLLLPLRKRLNWLRQRASSQSRKLVDRWVFGDHDPDMPFKMPDIRHLWMKQHIHGLVTTQQQIFEGASMPNIMFDELRIMNARIMTPSDDFEIERTSPGPAYLPSICFEGTTLDQLPLILKESLHRQPLLLHPVVKILEHANRRADADELQGAELVRYLRGRDSPFPAVNPDQGHGTFEYAQVHLWANTSLERVGELLKDPGSSGNDLLQLGLLWEAAPWKARPDLLQYAQAGRNHYDAQLHSLINVRCFGRSVHQKRI